jgi:hypothetical protein
LLEEKVTVLSPVFISVVVDVIVYLLDLIKEVLGRIRGNRNIIREEFTWTYISTEVALNVI